MVEFGGTFLVPSGPADYLHLHVIATPNIDAPDMRLLVPISSIKPDSFFDETCIIETGEHEFITKRSYVAYRHIQQRSASKISACLQSGEFILKPNLQQHVLARLVTGISTSLFTAPWVLAFVRDHCPP
tara:strand:- start:32 stop:418 length:387 start_codon:yes stop_codon:yes gene_type:complete